MTDKRIATTEARRSTHDASGARVPESPTGDAGITCQIMYRTLLVLAIFAFPVSTAAHDELAAAWLEATLLKCQQEFMVFAEGYGRLATILGENRQCRSSCVRHTSTRISLIACIAPCDRAMFTEFENLQDWIGSQLEIHDEPPRD